MSKTLNGGDQILVNRFVYKVTDPKTNDIIVFLLYRQIVSNLLSI